MRISRSPVDSPLLFVSAAAVAIALSCSKGDSNVASSPIDGGVSNDTAAIDSPGGEAECSGTQLSCAGACVDVSSSAANCGGCGKACAGSCCEGACVEGGDCTFAITRVSPDAGWQNGGEWLELEGQGFVEGMRVSIGAGVAPVLVRSASRAIVQTPPGPFGPTTVKLALGSKTALTRGAFRYTASGLSTPWQQKPLAKLRGEFPGVAVMQDGRVLVAGGTVQPDHPEKSLDTAEIYTRATDKVTTSLGKMSSPRWRNAALTLLSGKVLVLGGACWQPGTGCTGDPQTADLYDPTTDLFSPTKGKPNKPRVDPHLVMLADGRVFVTSSNDPSIELYDPKTDSFTLVDHGTLHDDGFAVRLLDGRVLFGTGSAGRTDCELFDPDTSTFKPTKTNVNDVRWWPNAHTLPDGRVLLVGGYGGSASAGGAWTTVDTIEAFDPKSESFTKLPYKLTIGRASPSTALVRDGTVLVMGGYTKPGDCASMSATVDQIDPVKGTVSVFARLPNTNTEWNAVTLLDGSVLSVGGGECGALTSLPDIDFLPGLPGPK